MGKSVHVTTAMADILTTIFPQHSSTSPEWDTVVQDIIRYDDAPSPTVYIDITTTSPTMRSSNPELGRAELDVYSYTDVPSSTALVIVTASSSQHSEDPDVCIVSEMDLLNRGQYLVQTVMGEGSFGLVAKAVDTFSATGDMVAIKVLKNRCDYDEVAAREMAMLHSLKALDPDTCGIVRFYDSFMYEGFQCMVFESLDINLLEFLNERGSPMDMTEMRCIIQQVWV